MPQIGRLGQAGLAKEGTLGVLQTPPTRFRRFQLPFNFSTDIALLMGKGVSGIADEVQRTAQGAGQLKGGKMKYELDLLEVGDDLMAMFGVDTVTETASFIVQLGVNDTIDWGAAYSEAIAAGTYKIGATSATDVGTLCALLYSAMHAVDNTLTLVTFTPAATGGGSLAFTFSGSTTIKWKTGTNTAKSIGPLLGFPTSADSTGATITGANIAAVYSHAFSRIQSATPPTYSWWQKTGLDYPQHVGCMLSKLELAAKAKEFIEMDAEWLGLKYDSTGVTQSAVYSALNPCKFSHCAFTIGGAPSANYDDVKLTLNNSVAVEHAVSASIWGTKIYSKGFKCDVNLSLMVEDLTEWAKWLAGTQSSMSLAITGVDLIKPGFPYSLTVGIPVLAYAAAPRQLPNGLIKIVFTGHAVNLNQTSSTAPVLVNNYGLAY